MEDLKPGRFLDALVAEKVMGWKHCTHTAEGLHFGFPPSTEKIYSKETPLPHFSTDIAAAWEVVGVLNDRWNVEIISPESPAEVEVVVTLNGTGVNPFFVAEAETAAHAICLAALGAEAQLS